MKCTLCGKVETHRYACNPCIDQTRRRLRELELYATWLTLPDLLAPIRSGGGRGAPGYASRPPIRLDAVVMADPRSRLEPPPTDQDRGIGLDNDDAWPILDTLTVLAGHIRQAHGQPEPTRPTLAGEVGYLLGHLDWAANHAGIAELADNIRQLHAQARATAHDQPPKPLATCMSVGCDAKVYPPPPRRSSTRCTGCGRTYTGLDLVRLRTQET